MRVFDRENGPLLPHLLNQRYAGTMGSVFMCEASRTRFLPPHGALNREHV